MRALGWSVMVWMAACSSSRATNNGEDAAGMGAPDLAQAGGTVDLSGVDLAHPAGTASPLMSFFVTSTGNGAAGGNFGGLAGADAKCAALAAAAGSTRTFRAYLSTATENARDRIGAGPWFNYAGDKISDSVATLHQCDPTGAPGGTPLCAPFAYPKGLSELGVIPPPNEHDILTGSDETGGAVVDTCQNWTSSADSDAGQVGHFDASDTGMVIHDVLIYIWGGAHVSRGCSLVKLMETGGVGRLYCFAIN